MKSTEETTPKGTDRTERSRLGQVRVLRVRVCKGAALRSYVQRETGALSIGSADGNDLVIEETTVSRYHLELRRTARGIRVVDLESTNGTFVRGVRIERAMVSAGSTIRIGDVELIVEDGTHERVVVPRSELPGILSQSEVMQRVAQEVHLLSQSALSVWIHGETGTGKEVIARALHSLSPRASNPFILVDCGALPPTLAASVLFGHNRGAFTGAVEDRRGAFELAEGGTIFLDEVGELAPEVQPALLRVLEHGTFRRLGSTDERSSDVRIVCATHRDLRVDVNNGLFRADLYFRLAAARVTVPPLRDRPEDITMLIRHFAREFTDSNARVFGANVLQRLKGRQWNGNVRELRNYVQAAIALGGLDGPKQAQQETGFQWASGAAPGEAVAPFRKAKAEAIARFEEEYLGGLIRSTNGNASAAARIAQMDRVYLLSLLRKYGLR